MHIIINFETLGGPYDSKIVSASHLTFDPRVVNSQQELVPRVHFFQFDYKDPEQSDWVVSPQAKVWWMSQSKTDQEMSLKITDTSVTLSAFVESLQEAIRALPPGSTFIWGRGAIFHFACLDRILHKLGYSDTTPSFYSVFSVRDVRTFVDAVALATGKPQDKLNGYHQDIAKTIGYVEGSNPISNVVRDAMMIQACWAILTE